MQDQKSWKMYVKGNDEKKVLAGKLLMCEDFPMKCCTPIFHSQQLQCFFSTFAFVGDFNIDLLKIETLNSNQEYYNLLCSYGFLPQIIQPTRVVVNQSPSLINNIFTNNINAEIRSGNIF